MYDKTFIGRRCASVSKPPELEPISKIVLWVDSENCYEAGDNTGREFETTCPYGSQQMADDLLAKLRGYVYKPLEAEDAIIDPAAEIGDAVTVDGRYTILANAELSFDSLLTFNVSAPGASELPQEYSFSNNEKVLSRKIARTRSLISKTSEEIRMEVSNEIEGLLAAIELDITQIVGRVEDTEAGLSQSVRLAADGVTITNASGSKLEIDGGQLKAESIETSAFKAKSITADKLNITGAITFDDLNKTLQVYIDDAYDMAEANQLPSYIESTYIDSVSIRSPTIIAGTFIGNEFDVIAENAGMGGFNLYGKYSNRSVHAFSISYSGGLTPSVTIDAPAGGNVYWDVAATYVGGDFDIGLNDIYYNIGNGIVASLRELDARVTALEA